MQPASQRRPAPCRMRGGRLGAARRALAVAAHVAGRGDVQLRRSARLGGPRRVRQRWRAVQPSSPASKRRRRRRAAAARALLLRTSMCSGSMLHSLATNVVQLHYFLSNSYNTSSLLLELLCNVCRAAAANI